jgi:chromosomal replication initiation ATPase DnaA
VNDVVQLALDLGHRTALGREDFLVAASNEAAVLWVDRWPDWPAPALTIHGPAGCGKSHLAEVWRARCSALLFPATELVTEGLDRRLGERNAVVVEDADRGVDETALLHLYNMLSERRGHLLLTAREPPKRWTISLADLASRLRAAPAVAVATPDEALIAGVLVKLFADRQLRIGAELIVYLVARMERSFEAAARLVAALDAAALAARRPVTARLARSVLDALEKDDSKLT